MLFSRDFHAAVTKSHEKQSISPGSPYFLYCTWSVVELFDGIHHLNESGGRTERKSCPESEADLMPLASILIFVVSNYWKIIVERTDRILHYVL